jgi:putative DNA primase/helicase
MASSTDDDREDLEAPAFSEEAVALLFAGIHAAEQRYVAAWGRWLYYDGTRRKFDETRQTWTRARRVCREIALTINKPKEAKMMASAKTRAAVVSLAGEDERLAATVDQWDLDPWLLNTPSGVVDLRTGKLRKHDAADYMTKTTAVTPDASCPTPLWSKFLKRVTDGDLELQKYLARVSGYALTGLTGEHEMYFLFGDGRNGKGVFMGTVSDILDDYHRTAPIETFTATNNEQHPTDLAMLRGARLVTATETEVGRRWAESRIKMMTGGDPISARFMRQDFFTYKPQFKLIISGNNKPGLRSVDEAIKARIKLVPFSVFIPPEERDKDLKEKLKAEWPGILAWMIEGGMQWQRGGLATPKVVSEATDQYLQDEDIVKTWINDELVEDPARWVSNYQLYECWKNWVEDHGEFLLSSRRLWQRLEAMGYERERGGANKDERGFLGLEHKHARRERQRREEEEKELKAKGIKPHRAVVTRITPAKPRSSVRFPVSGTSKKAKV